MEHFYFYSGGHLQKNALSPFVLVNEWTGGRVELKKSYWLRQPQKLVRKLSDLVNLTK